MILMNVNRGCKNKNSNDPPAITTRATTKPITGGYPDATRALLVHVACELCSLYTHTYMRI